LIQRIEQGSTFSEAIQTVEGWLPNFDSALLEAGERSGRLPQCFKLLAQYYSERCSLARQVIHDLMYPLFLFHFAIFIGPFPDLFLTWNIIAYLTKTLGVLAPIYLITFVIIFASQGRHGESWRAFIETLTHWIPFLGPARRALALSRLAAALEALINAGGSGTVGSRAYQLLNAVRARVGLAPVDVTQTSIEKERRLELAGEGLRWPDLVRWGKAGTTLAFKGFVPGKHEIFPIPQAELNNTKLVQNDAWK